MQAVNERQQKMSQVEKLTMEAMHKLANKALEIIPSRAAYFAQLVGVDLWADHNLQSEKQVGKLFGQWQSEL